MGLTIHQILPHSPLPSDGPQFQFEAAHVFVQWPDSLSRASSGCGYLA